jgi:hypothetical protein
VCFGVGGITTKSDIPIAVANKGIGEKLGKFGYLLAGVSPTMKVYGKILVVL